ncbi:MAG: winged helix-turn-helix transcriptional regulator [Bacilli bacterium]|nr:winged helix-turn-helix transcriptional regulator [Bacilli bacterium]
MGDKVGDKVGVKLNDTQRKMLELLRDNPNLTQPQLMIALGLGETAAQNNISFLRNHGFIRRIGSKKTGYWEVIADEE